MPSLFTQVVHAGEPNPRIEGAVSMPIFQTANFENGDETSYAEVKYTRLNNTPNHIALHDKLATLEGGEAALVLASGMAAISTTLLALLQAGDHLLAQKTLYGGTFSFIHEDLRRFGVQVDYVDASRPESWPAKLKTNTKLFYTESISNPLMEVPELEEIVAFARVHKLTSVIDNTFTSPVNFRPLALGFDFSLHSATKYLNGHSDVIAGAVIGTKAGITKVNHMATHLGGTLDPHACFLLHRGIKTLAVRMQQHNSSGLRIAHFLAEHPKIKVVHFPGLPGSPSFGRAQRHFKGCGGMLSFELKEGEAGEFIRRLKIPIVAASLGGVESLLIQPSKSSHLGLGAEERAKAGISDALIRYSVGIEDPDDLISDLTQALD